MVALGSRQGCADRSHDGTSGASTSASIGIGRNRVLRPEDYTTIRMRTDGLDWVIAPHVPLVDRLDVILGSHLSVDVVRLIWRDECMFEKRPGFSGHLTLALHPDAKLFTALHETVAIGDLTVLERHSAHKGFSSDSDGLSVCGQLDARASARLRWTARDGRFSRAEAWGFGLALRTAVALCTGCSRAVLEREVRRGKRTYRGLRPYGEPHQLQTLA